MKGQNRSLKNKTIDISVNDGREYLERCVKPCGIMSLSDITDRTINGDSFEVLSRLPDSFVDLLLVDPPYNLTKKFGDTSFNKMSSEQYEEYTEKWVLEVRHILKDTASIYVCADWESSLVIEKVISKYFNIRNRITWQREKGRGTKNNWKNSMEDIWYATVSDRFTFNADDVKMRRRVLAPYKEAGMAKDWEESADGRFRNTFSSNFWNDISIPYWSMPENTAHPTQKPEKLYAKLILASSDKGDFVFDPFAGSGSSLVAAKKLGRCYSGIEINEQYCVWSGLNAFIEETLIIVPPCFAISRANTCVGMRVPRKFRLNTNEIPSGSRSKNVFTPSIVPFASSSAISSGVRLSRVVEPFGLFPPAPFKSISALSYFL